MITLEHQEKINKAVNYYKDRAEYISLAKCGKMFGINRQTLAKHLSINNVMYDKTKYHCNENYFDFIDTEDKAYWLGFLTADGCIKTYKNSSKRYAISLSLCKNDALHVQHFLECLESNQKYYIEKNRKSVFKGSTCSAKVTIHCKHMYTTLANKYGFTSTKSTNEMPYYDIENADIVLLKAYIRGMFDGDGWLSQSITRYKDNKYVSYEVGIASSKEMVTWINDMFSKYVGLSFVSEVRAYKTLYRIRYSNKNAKAILDFLYNDATIYLPRKYEKYKSLPSLGKILHEA